jgi:putative sterol carrier protein
MAQVKYLTPEYMEAVTVAFQDPQAIKALEKLTTKLAWRVKAEPSWGLDQDIMYAAEIKAGVISPLHYVTEEEAKSFAEFFMVAKPETWKKIDTGKADFAAQLVMQKVKLGKGSMMQMMKLAPYSKDMNKVMMTLDVLYPDQMSPDVLADYRKTMSAVVSGEVK